MMGVIVKTNKHHCRRCGLVFCGKCSSRRTKLPELGLDEEVRVCDACYDHVNKKNKVSAKVRAMLVEGTVFRKHGRSGWPHPRMVRLSEGLGLVHWHKVDNQSRVENLPIVDVISIKVGQETDVFRRSGDPEKKDLCFSIVTKTRTLDLEAETRDMRDQWVNALTVVVEYLKAMSPEERREQEDKAREQHRWKEQRAAERAKRVARLDAIKKKYHG